MEDKLREVIYTDGEIVDMYWQRDEGAIDATDRKYGKYLYKIAYNIISEADDSRSALNDTYLGAWSSMPPNRPQRLLLYLSKIARRVSIDLLRKAGAKKRPRSELISSLDELSECIGTDAEQEADRRELARALNSFLSSLEVRRRQIFVCRYYFADSVEDIAKALSVGASFIYKELSKIRADLKGYLEAEGYKI